MIASESELSFPQESGVDVSSFPKFEFSKRELVEAGDALAGELIWRDDTAEQIRLFFRIANSWRDSHAFPMRRIRQELLGHIRSARAKGFTSARLKRMPSIRRKLSAQPWKLNEIQDLGGCRAVFNNMSDLKAALQISRDRSIHNLYNQTDYIKNPKADGYRSHHLMYKFSTIRDDEISFKGRRIEIQIRTRLQHSWATAVEAIGLFRGEDFKSGSGGQEWRRLFQLMSAEIALAENCPEPLGLGSHRDRVKEIRDLNRRLDALKELDSVRKAVDYTSNYVIDAANKPDYYLIQYDHENGKVRVSPYSTPSVGVKSYDSAEEKIRKSGDGKINAVLVEVDQLENLKEAYPNYFGDVELFASNLRLVARGEEAKEYFLDPQPRAAEVKRERPDDSWLRTWKRLR